MITLFEKYREIKDYSKSMDYITIDEDFLNDMKYNYDYESNHDIYFFDKDYHFATLFYEGPFLELKHDGSLMDSGQRR